MSDAQAKPRPLIDDLTRPFWDAAKEHRLVIQRCQACSYFNHPPREMCDVCHGGEMAFEQVSGRGTIYSFSVMHQTECRRVCKRATLSQYSYRA